METIRAIAPAKINLELKVSPLENGQTLHKVKNVMHTISLHDSLSVMISEASDLEFSIKTFFEGTQPFECRVDDNLIVKAAKQFFSDNELCDKLSVYVELKKRIPHQAGLGGGSSDAAAMLKILASLFEPKVSLSTTAASIGSDVPFFLEGGHREFGGTGVADALSFSPLTSSLVLVKPEKGVATSAVYSEFDKYGPTNDKNDLQKPAISLCPEIGEIIEFLPDGAQMTGSGSCVFYLCESFMQAASLASKANLQGWWARACSTIPSGVDLH